MVLSDVTPQFAHKKKKKKEVLRMWTGLVYLTVCSTICALWQEVQHTSQAPLSAAHRMLVAE